MIAVLGGLGAAIAWGLATIAASRASRRLGSTSTTAWVVFLGLLACLPLLALDRPSGPIAPADLWWLALAGLGYVAGMVCNYAALARGKVGIAAPIASTEGAIAAVIAILAGEAAGLPMLVALGVIVLGIVLSTLTPGTRSVDAVSGGAAFLGFAVSAAALFGVSLYAAGRSSDGVPPSWVVTSGRLAGSLAVMLPLVLLRRLRFERPMLPFLAFAALAEVVGVLSFAVGARDGIAVAAVLASQFAVVATLAARYLGEPLARRQLVGVGLSAIGVAIVTLLRV